VTVSFKGDHFAEDIILTSVRWCVAYPLSHRQREGVSKAPMLHEIEWRHDPPALNALVQAHQRLYPSA
jgi:transposase-like protein